MRRRQRGQVLVIVAVWMVALIGSAALVLLAGSVEWQRSQLQQLADHAALDAALKIGVGCSGASASTVITEADAFLATQRTRTGSLSIAGASCAAPYTGTDTFATGLSETVNYPYRLHQQQVEVVLTLSLPISFGSYMGATNTTVTRRAVAQQLKGATSAVSATTLSCTGGQFNVSGSVAVSNTVSLSGSCALYAHQRFDAASGTYSDLGNVSAYNPGQVWVNAGGACLAGANAGSTSAICSDGYERTGHTTVSCGTSGTSAYLSAGNVAVNPNPCAAGKAPQPATTVSTTLPPEPNADPAAIATLPGGAACTAAGVYPNLVVGGTTVGTAKAGTPAPTLDASGFWHFKPSCYGYLNPSLSSTKKAVLDPGFYYFNGSGFAGGGGICLDGGTLLARDVTLEFVNQAGFSSATCTPAGSTYWLQGTNGCGGAGCHLQATDPNSGQHNVTYNTSARSFIWSETASNASAQTVPAGTTYTLTYSTSGGHAINATVTLYYSATTPCAAPTGATNLISWSVSLPDSTGNTVASPASGAAVTIPGGDFLCLELSGTTSSGNENFNFNDTNHAAKISSSSTILPAAASVCTAPCQFGSVPCSVSICPPNTGADSPNNLTWFAAPCSSAPAADSASCLGAASWCPSGDRSCWNELIWTPATSTGQFAITGGAATMWLLGSVFWLGAGTCTDTVNGTSTLDGTIACSTLSVSAAAGAGTAVGSDYGVSTALVEAILLE